MARWKRELEAPRRYDGYDAADDTARTFVDFLYEERLRLHESLDKNIAGFTGQEQPTPVHLLGQRLLNYQVAYCGQDWQTQASASFALLYSPVSESFGPVLDLGVHGLENNDLLKARYHIGRQGVLRVVEYMPHLNEDEASEQETGQALASFLFTDPFNRDDASQSHSLNDPIYDDGLIVGPKELDAMINALSTNTESKPHNKVYKIPGHIRKSA